MIGADLDKVVWTTDTTGLFALQLSINKRGNLVLVNAFQRIMWQSFDKCTDTLVDGQPLREGQHLTSNTYSKTMSTSLFHLYICSSSLSAFVHGNERIKYLAVCPDIVQLIPGLVVLKSVPFRKGRMVFSYFLLNETMQITLKTRNSVTIQILTLDDDGDLRM